MPGPKTLAKWAHVRELVEEHSRLKRDGADVPPYRVEYVAERLGVSAHAAACLIRKSTIPPWEKGARGS
jgi:hypothetical protein